MSYLRSLVPTAGCKQAVLSVRRVESKFEKIGNCGLEGDLEGQTMLEQGPWFMERVGMPHE